MATATKLALTSWDIFREDVYLGTTKAVSKDKAENNYRGRLLRDHNIPKHEVNDYMSGVYAVPAGQGPKIAKRRLGGLSTDDEILYSLQEDMTRPLEEPFDCCFVA